MIYSTVDCLLQIGKWIVIFCDEINLPDMDKYGTQRVISFIRQLLEHGGFYRTSDQVNFCLSIMDLLSARNRILWLFLKYERCLSVYNIKGLFFMYLCVVYRRG
jgi:hypothetical protein